MSPRRGDELEVKITPEDEAWGRHQDRWACALVRAIQREMPSALRVRVDTKDISFSLPNDHQAGPTGTRYYFETPADVVRDIIKPFDEHKVITGQTFRLIGAYSIEPIRHSTAEQRAAQRTNARHNKPRRRAAGSKSGAVHTLNRFLDYVAEEEASP
jgi:hypothetical protein